jgi:thiamine-phosphate pyrophosphorylase
MNDYLKLYLILETKTLRLPLADFIMQAVEGGVSAIQLRDKGLSDKERYQTALVLATLLADKDVLLIINNTVDIALAVGADGVHLGHTDMPIAAVQRNFPDLLIGSSCNNMGDVVIAMAEGADYAGIGPAYATATKPDHREVLSPSGIRELAFALNIPSIAIGGIGLDNVHNLSSAGVCGVAVSSALCNSSEPYNTAMALRQQIELFYA